MNITTGLLNNVKINNIAIQTSILSNKNNYAVCASRDVKYIVIHYTGNTKDTAINNAKYFNSGYRGASAHFFVDDSKIYQSVALKDRAWHCGSTKNSTNDCINQNSIGIEMCTSGKAIVSEKTKNNTIALTVYLCGLLGIKAGDVDTYVIRHYDVGIERKPCPAQMVANEKEWQEFKDNIRKAMGGNKKSTVNLQQWGCLLSDIEHLAYIPMNGTKGETLTKAAARATWNGRNPDAICNAEFFNMTTYDFASGVVSKANGQENWTDQWGISFVNNIIPKISYKNNLNATDWLAGYPLLLKDGEVAIPAGFAALPGKRARTAIGYDDYRFAMFWVTEADGCTIEDFAEAIKERGFKYAINFDGGGSTAGATTMWSYDQGRATRGKVGLWVKGGTGNKLQKTTTNTIEITNQKENTLLQDKTKSRGQKFTVNASSGLRLRRTPINGDTLEVLNNGTTVTWYGYYMISGGQIWYFVATPSGKSGYVNGQYVK